MPDPAVTERRPAAIIEIGAWPETAGPARAALERLIDLSVPTVLGEATMRGTRTVMALTPGRWLAVDEEPLPFASLAALAAPGTLVVTDLSDARAVFRIAGHGAVAVLRQGPKIDLDRRSFAPGRVALTSFQQMGVLIHRVAIDSFDLYIDLSYLHACRAWLADAAREL